MTIEQPVKRGRGRPPRDEKGKHMWIPADFVAIVSSILNEKKKPQQVQQ